MAEFVTLKAEGLQALHTMDERLVSYNVEMTEVTGGTFWKAYSEAQVDGTEEHGNHEAVGLRYRRCSVFPPCQ